MRFQLPWLQVGRPAGTPAQASSIGRTVMAMIGLLGGIQLFVSGMLLISAYQGYVRVQQHAALNAASHALSVAAIALNREHNQTLALLGGKQAPDIRQREQLLAMRQRTDRQLQMASTASRQHTSAGQQTGVQILQDNLREARRQIDTALGQRPFAVQESTLFSWQLVMTSVMDAIGRLQQDNAFWLAGEADPAQNRLVQLRLDLWRLGGSLQYEANALVLRSAFNRSLNATEEYELVRQREQGSLLLDSLRSSVRLLALTELIEPTRRLAALSWQLQQASQRQLAELDMPSRPAWLRGEHDALAGQVFTECERYLELLNRLTSDRLTAFRDGYVQSLLLHGLFVLASLLLYAALLKRLRRRVMSPLMRMQRLMDAAPDAVITLDEAYRVVTANQGAARLFGYPLSDLPGVSLGALIRFQGGPLLDGPLPADIEQEGVGRCQAGSEFHADITIRRVEGGESDDRYLLVVRDARQRHAAEQSLAASLRLLSAIHHIESLLFARSARHVVYETILDTLLQECGQRDGIILAVDSGRDKAARFRTQVTIGEAPPPAWLTAFLGLPVVQAMQAGQETPIRHEDGWGILLVEVDQRTVMVIALKDAIISEAKRQLLQPLLGACGSVVTFYTEEDRRRQSERHLREVLQNEEAIYAASPVGLLRLDSSFRIVRANAAAEQLFAVTPGGLQGRHLSDVLADEAAWDGLQHTLLSGQSRHAQVSSEAACVNMAGQPLWVWFNGRRLPSETDELDMIVACVDLTDRQTAEEALRRARDAAAAARHQLQAAVESLDEAFSLFDAQDRLVLCNRRFAGLFAGQPALADLLGQDFASLLAAQVDAGEVPEEGFDQAAWRAERMRRHRENAPPFLLRTGNRWYQVSDHAIPDGGSVCIWADVSGLKQQELDLLQARDLAEQANRAKSAFLATMSHEIRTPMNGVLGLLELMSLTRLDPEQRDTLETIQESSRSLLRLIDDILDFSKIEAGKLDILPEPCAISDILHKVHQLYADMAERKGLDFRLEIALELAPALAVDPLRLRQILQNFCSNALKFTQEGEVVLRVLVLADHDDSQQLRFEVDDTGIGIARENLQRLFEPFTQAENSTARRFGGTGLGLAICRRLADMMAGQISMASEPDVGTTAILELTLPKVALPQPAETTARHLPASQPGGAGEAPVWPVLFVEDNPTNRKLTLKQFELLGYPVVSAENGVEAITRWQKEPFSLVLTDCHMPVMDGYELARTIRYYESTVFDSRRIPIIACTANASQEEVQKTREAGMDDFMTKPLGLATLQAMLEKWLPQQADHVGMDSASERRPVAEGDDDGTRVEPPPPPINRQLLEPYSGGDWLVERGILDEFMSANEQDVAVLQAAVAEGDLAKVAWAAHRIKGASRMVGADMLAEAAGLLEAAGKAGDVAQINTEWPGFVQTLAVLKHWLANQPF